MLIYHNPKSATDYHWVDENNVDKKKALQDWADSKLVVWLGEYELEEGYCLTQNFEEPWTSVLHQKDIPFKLYVDGPTRSTSVGDFIQNGSGIYMVAAIGFVRILDAKTVYEEIMKEVKSDEPASG